MLRKDGFGEFFTLEQGGADVSRALKKQCQIPRTSKTGRITSRTTKLSPSSPQRTISEYEGSSNILALRRLDRDSCTIGRERGSGGALDLLVQLPNLDDFPISIARDQTTSRALDLRNRWSSQRSWSWNLSSVRRPSWARRVAIASGQERRLNTSQRGRERGRWRSFNLQPGCGDEESAIDTSTGERWRESRESWRCRLLPGVVPNPI